MSQDLCPIWQTPATFNDSPENCKLPIGQSNCVIDSPRAGGKYKAIRYNPEDYAPFENLDSCKKSLLTTYLINRRSEGFDVPTLDSKFCQPDYSFQPLTTVERSDRLLKYIKKHSPCIGDHFEFHTNLEPNLDNPSWIRYAEILAYSESSKSTELDYLLDSLKSKSLIRHHETSSSNLHIYIITKSGDDYLDDILNPNVQNISYK